MPLDKNVKYDSAEYFEIKKKIKDLGRNTLIITELAQTKLSHRLIWELKEVVAELCIDSLDAKQPEEMVTKRNVKVWDFQANNAKMDSPSDLSGWYNSYNGDPFSEDEMKEYIDDTKQKLMPILSKQSRVLEVGVGVGQVALEMAQMVSLYDGCDISRVVLERLSYLIAHKNIKNIELFQCEADALDKIGKIYDVIIFNSVIQYFSGYNYMTLVLKSFIDAMPDNGYIFLADVYDLEKKQEYIDSIGKYAAEHIGCKYKKGFEHELFYSRDFWNVISDDFQEIENVVISDRIGKLENEMKWFRYDVMIKINKGNKKKNGSSTNKKNVIYSAKEILECMEKIKEIR